MNELIIVFPVREGSLRGVSTSGEIREVHPAGRFPWTPWQFLSDFCGCSCAIFPSVEEES